MKLSDIAMLHPEVVINEGDDRATQQTKFETFIDIIKRDFNEEIEVPQLKDEFDVSDFQTYMLDNSLFVKKLNQ